VHFSFKDREIDSMQLWRRKTYHSYCCGEEELRPNHACRTDALMNVQGVRSDVERRYSRKKMSRAVPS